VTPDETTSTPETKPAPRQAKTARPRRATTSPTKTKAKTTRAKKRAAPALSYGYAVGEARRSETARTLPALEMFEDRPPPSPPPTAVAFVSFPGFDEAQAKLSATLKAFMDRVGGAINEAATLKVKTYVSDDIEGVKLDAQGNLTGDMRLRALTNIELDGDITAIIPMRPEGMDETLWAAHVDMVKQAQANRTELVKLAISAVSGLVTAIKPG
jgi:hypothetical protein